MFEWFEYAYMERAFWASAMIGVSCGLLGCFVVLRRMAMIGDALSHAILPGVVAGFFFFGHNSLAIFGGALIAGLFTSIIITWIQHNSITKDDSSVGIVFTAMFSLGIIGISWITKREGVHLDMKDFLFGNVLGVSDEDLWLTAMVTLFIVCSVVIFYSYFFASTFDPLIALSMGISVATIHYFLMFMLSVNIVASIQSVGVILVVAMLIVPASAAYLLTSKLQHMLLISALIGLLSAVSGLFISEWLEITPGPTMTLVACAFFLLALFFSPKRGLIQKRWNRFKKIYTIEQQDILKFIHKKVSEDGQVQYLTLAEKFQYLPSWLVRIHLQHLIFHGHVSKQNQAYTLTPSGLHAANVLLRAHRMWESYLAQKMNVPLSQIHESADALEHILPEEFIDQLEMELGYPDLDPHGAPIPKIEPGILPLFDLAEGAIGHIAEQNQDVIVKLLWQKGIFWHDMVVVQAKDSQNITVSIKNKTFVFQKEDAKLLLVSS